MTNYKRVMNKNSGLRSYTSRDKAILSRDFRLNLMFTTAAVATNVFALPVGTVLDRYGPRICGIVGSIFLALGSGFVIIAPDVSFDGYIPGYLFLALGGPFIFISSFQLSNCFPRHSGLILALLTGAFDSSSAVFLAYRLIYTATNGSFSPRKFFLFYLIVPMFILIVQLLIMPYNSYKTVGELVKEAEDPSHDVIPENSEDLDDEDVVEILHDQRRARRESVLSELSPLLGRKGGEDKAKRQEQEKRAKSGVWGALHGKSAFQQIKTPWFILITLFVVVQMTRINYFVASKFGTIHAANTISLMSYQAIRSQYEYLLNHYNLAEHVNHVFDVALPLGGIISIPFIGLILDNLSTTTCLSVLVGLATLIGVLGVLPYTVAAYANVALFVIYRPLYYTAVSDYAAKVFGFHTFGKVYGLIICIAGLFNFSQSALDALTHITFDNNPVPVNLVLMSLVLVIGIVLIAYVHRKTLSMSRDWLEEEAEDAPERRMPDLMERNARNRASPQNGTI